MNTQLEKLGWMVLPLEKMVKASWNYKDEDSRKSKKLKGNLQKNGQVENLIVRQLEDGLFEVVNGNHRYDDMMALGWESAVVYNAGKISDAAARRLAIETNETKFPTNNLILASLIEEIKLEFNDDDLAATLPFSEAELEGMVGLLSFDWSDPTPLGVPSGDQEPGGDLLPGDQEPGDGVGAPAGDPGDDDGQTVKLIIEVELHEKAHLRKEIQAVLKRFNTAVLIN